MEQYFISNKKEQLGPYSFKDLEDVLITSETLIWKKGLNKWVKATEVEELSVLIHRVPPPIEFQKKESFIEFYMRNKALSIFFIAFIIFCFTYIDDIMLKLFFKFMNVIDAVVRVEHLQFYFIIFSIILPYIIYRRKHIKGEKFKK